MRSTMTSIEMTSTTSPAATQEKEEAVTTITVKNDDNKNDTEANAIHDAVCAVLDYITAAVEEACSKPADEGTGATTTAAACLDDDEKKRIISGSTDISVEIGAAAAAAAAATNGLKRKKAPSKNLTKSSTSPSGNRGKQNLKREAYTWDGVDLVEKIASAFEYHPEAAITWFCHGCFRANEEYEATNDEVVPIDCPTCKRSWHGQCYETEYSEDSEYWDIADESNTTQCYNCRKGIWKCLLCGVSGIDQSVNSTTLPVGVDAVYKCAERNCISRCHQKCVEAELLRPKSCFSQSSLRKKARGGDKTLVGRRKTLKLETLPKFEILPPIINGAVVDAEITYSQSDDTKVAVNGRKTSTLEIMPNINGAAGDAEIAPHFPSDDAKVVVNGRKSSELEVLPPSINGAVAADAEIVSDFHSDDTKVVSRKKAKSEILPDIDAAADTATIAAASPTTTTVEKYSFRCGRHQCLLCKRLGRSVTVETEDVFSTTTTQQTLCKANVGKDGAFKRIMLVSCMRCCRAVHFHPHCLPPTYVPCAYNANLMLCEEHVVCKENPDVEKKLQETQNKAANVDVTDVTQQKKKKRRAAKKQNHGKKRKNDRYKNQNEEKAELDTCSCCGNPASVEAGELTACEKCPARVHMSCLPAETQSQEPNKKWFCVYHDENESMLPILLYDVVWCKDKQFPFWPARVVPWEDVPKTLTKQYAKSASGLYAVYYFQASGSTAKEFAFLSSQRILPFEENQCRKEFLASWADKSSKSLKATEAAVKYFFALQHAREIINAKTFQIFSASWEYATIATNQPMPGVQYCRSKGNTTNRKAILNNVDNTSPPAAIVTAAVTVPPELPATPSTSLTSDSSEPQPINVTAAAPLNSTADDEKIKPPPRITRQRRAAATKCSTILGDYTDDGSESGTTKCECRTQPCDPLICLNAHARIECDDKNCRHGVAGCNNRRLKELHAPPGPTRRYNTTLKVSNCGARGKGLLAKIPFETEQYIIEYVGEVILPQERERREVELFKKYDQPMFYFMSLDAKRVLDAQHKGNISRFANHSCNPNAKILRVTYQGDFHIVLQACRAIAPGEEITYNYDWGTKGKNPMACKCGAPNCRQLIGEKSNSNKRKRGDDDNDELKPSKGKKAKKQKAGASRKAKSAKLDTKVKTEEL